MPSIQRVSIEPDTLTIVTKKGTRTFTRADIPANVLTQPISQIEATVNNFLASANELDDVQVRVHIFSVNPQLVWTIWCGNPGVHIPASWWDLGD